MFNYNFFKCICYFVYLNDSSEKLSLFLQSNNDPKYEDSPLSNPNVKDKLVTYFNIFYKYFPLIREELLDKGLGSICPLNEYVDPTDGSISVAGIFVPHKDYQGMELVHILLNAEGAKYMDSQNLLALALSPSKLEELIPIELHEFFMSKSDR